jgi:tetratricopeptide (TPR) repeat protein
MAGEFPFPILGHGVARREDLYAWIIFREPPAPRVTDLPAPFAIDDDGTHERILAFTADDFPKTGKKKLYAQLDAWLATVHARHAIRFVVFSDGDDEPEDPWNEWSQARVKKVLLPWFVEHWPALRSGSAAAVLAGLLARCVKTRRAEVIELAARAVEAALGTEPRIDGVLAHHLAALVDRLPDEAAKTAQLQALSPALRVRVWAVESSLVPDEKLVIETVRAVDRGQALGTHIADLADSLEAPRLHTLALEFPDAPMRSLVEIVDSLRGDALARVLDAHLARFAEDDDDLMTLLHHGLENELDPLIERCVAQAVDRDVPAIVANVLFATSRAGKPHEAARLGAEFVARYRQDHPEARLLATLYTNILLAYGATATCDDTCRMLTQELEQILEDDPAYFGFSGNAARDIAEGKAGKNILGSAYGSAACGRCVMGDGERAARWLEKAREQAWADLAIGANLICFQHMKDDPHLQPVIAEIGRAEVARLEAALAGSHEDVNAMFSLALTLHNGGFLDDAERYYRKVLAIRAQHADSLNNLGNIFATRGDIDGAIASYERAIAVQPMHPVFHACKAWALARGQRWADCVEAGHVAVRLAPNQAGGYFSRGAGYLGVGDRANAAADWKRAATLNPGWRGSEKDDPWFPDMVALIES